MASLQIASIAGAYPAANQSIPDGPPTAVKVIASGANGNVYGSDTKAVLNELTPIGGNVTITWPGGVLEVLTAPATRALRGEAISVA